MQIKNEESWRGSHWRALLAITQCPRKSLAVNDLNPQSLAKVPLFQLNDARGQHSHT